MAFDPLIMRLWDEATEEVAAPPRPSACDPKYRALGPIVWAVDRLGIDPQTLVWSLQPEYATHVWDGTKDPFVAVAEALTRWQNVGVESATGTGKTFFGAICVLWFLDCYPPYQDDRGTEHAGGLVVTTAPKEDQLKLHIWKEIRQQWPRFQKLHPAAQLSHLRIQMRRGDDAWAAHGFACGVGADEESATKAQGFHAEWMLIITEETPGIHAAIMTAFENTATWDTNVRLAFGNPDSPNDQLHKLVLKPHVRAVRASALDHPNVVSGRPVVVGAISKSKIEERRRTYGEGSRLYRSRVRGLCPTEGSDSLIRYTWLKAAYERSKDRAMEYMSKGPPALGVDVANSPNGDKSCTVRGTGALCQEISARPCPDANVFGRETVLPLMQLYQIDRKHVGVDNVGVGIGTFNELKRLGKKVRGLAGGAKAWPHKGEEEFANLRSQMYWQCRVDLEREEIAIAEDDEELFDDLIAVTWDTRGGKIAVEPKEKIKARLGRSPDKGDAFVYWNWIRTRRATASSGGADINI
jgi:hypothetical protein